MKHTGNDGMPSKASMDKWDVQTIDAEHWGLTKWHIKISTMIYVEPRWLFNFRNRLPYVRSFLINVSFWHFDRGKNAIASFREFAEGSAEWGAAAEQVTLQTRRYDCELCFESHDVLAPLEIQRMPGCSHPLTDNFTTITE